MWQIFLSFLFCGRNRKRRTAERKYWKSKVRPARLLSSWTRRTWYVPAPCRPSRKPTTTRMNNTGERAAAVTGKPSSVKRWSSPSSRATGVTGLSRLQPRTTLTSSRWHVRSIHLLYVSFFLSNVMAKSPTWVIGYRHLATMNLCLYFIGPTKRAKDSYSAKLLKIDPSFVFNNNFLVSGVPRVVRSSKITDCAEPGRPKTTPVAPCSNPHPDVERHQQQPAGEPSSHASTGASFISSWIECSGGSSSSRCYSGRGLQFN